MRTFGRLCVLLLAVPSGALANTYTVTSVADSGAGTLRQAITDANGNAGADTIAFAISGSGVHTIVLASPLPNITETVTVDGYTQSGASANTHSLTQGSNAVILVEVDGENLAVGNACVTVASSDVTIRGLAINRCQEVGIRQTSGSNLVVAGNVIGATPGGAPLGGTILQFQGITFASGTGHVVGGPNPADRNVISGNRDITGLSGDGIYAGNVAAVTIQGNFIGTDAAVSQAVGNGIGIHATTSGAVQVGGSGAGEGNVISGNNDLGVNATAPLTMHGNFVGTDGTETRRLPNPGGGLQVGPGASIGGLNPGERNVIAFNGGLGGAPGAGISIMGTFNTGNTIRGNRIYDNVNQGIAFSSIPVPNDPGDGDNGPNGLQNYPIVTSVDYGAATTVHARFNSKPSMTYDVDFYANPACAGRPPLYEQGKDFAGTTQVTTDASGDATIDFGLPVVLAAGQPVTTVATDPSGNSSEFSKSIVLHTDTRSGPSAGGTSVSVFGQLFEDGATVTFGGVPASSVTFNNAGLLHATTPVLPAGTVNDIVVTNPGGGALTGTLDNGWIADFLDVPNSNSFYNDVIKLVANQITVGVGGGLYGVAQNIKRQSMAVFILKAEHGICYTPPPCSGVFGDVPCPSTFAPWIEAMAAEGITGGCGGGNFCPDNPVRRDQMAVFLLKGKHGATYVPPPCAGIFTDVACPSQFANWIEEMKTEGITSGCGGTNYCPSANNTRGQMATFISKTFLLN